MEPSIFKFKERRKMVEMEREGGSSGRREEDRHTTA